MTEPADATPTDVADADSAITEPLAVLRLAFPRPDGERLGDDAVGV